jgi:hypothetical protein
MQSAGGDDQVVGLAKAGPTLIFPFRLRRKLLTPGWRSAYAARSKIFRRPNHISNPSVALAVLARVRFGIHRSALQPERVCIIHYVQFCRIWMSS